MRLPLPLQEHLAPVPCGVARKEIEDFARKVAARFEFAPGESIDVLVRRIGGRIDYRDHVGAPEGWIPPGLVVDADGRFRIELPSLASDRRNALSIAEALGHYLLHWSILSRDRPGNPMMATRWVGDDGDPMERQAKFEAIWFSLELMAPSELLVRKAEREDVVSLSNYFGIPASSIARRLDALAA